MPYQIVLIERSGGVSGRLSARAASEGWGLRTLPDVLGVRESLRAKPADLVLVDPELLGPEASRHLEGLEAEAPATEILVLAPGAGSAGLPKSPGGAAPRFPEVPSGLEELVAQIRVRFESQNGPGSVRRRYGVHSVIGGSPSMQATLKLVTKVAASDAGTVLLRGESGTGKDLLARAIHYESCRASGPFITVMCTALQDNLLENDLFGHEKGAFTDAKTDKKGLFELAEHGSIFLNEIGDMGPNLQSKLLRVLDEQLFRRVGGTHDIRVDVRVIAATNRDLESLILEKKFRLDLFYRLNLFPVMLPPLRQRLLDLPALANLFLDRFRRKYHRDIRGLSAEALRSLERYDWPGNVRELKNVIERACLMAEGPEIQASDLMFWRVGSLEEARSPGIHLPPEGVLLDEVEKGLILEALERSRGNQTTAARLLGLSRYRLRSRIRKYGIRELRAQEDRREVGSPLATHPESGRRVLES
jgi:transcriptional regulator with PAS, ATPase and Fis domain